MLKKLLQRKPRFAPDLIDLVQYEKDLLYNRKYHRQPIPVRPIPNVGGGIWSESELQAMRNNRSQAQAIKERVFGIA